MRDWRGKAVLVLAMITVLSVQERSIADEPQQPIEWLTEYGAARREGIKLDRPVLLFVTSEHCGYCVKMHDVSFSNHKIIHELRSSFVPAKLNLASDSELAQELKVSIYPTTVIISPQGKILDYARGYLNPNELSKRMSDAISEHDSLASSR